MKPLSLLHRVLMVTSLLLSFNVMAFQEKKNMVLAISQIVEHASLDAVREGLLDVLHQKGYKEGDNLVVLYRNAQGNIATSTQIAQTLMANDPLPHVFVAIGTPTAQGAISAGRKHKIPVVFAAVTDPVSSKLVKDLEDHRPLVTGVIDFPPLKEQIQIMRKFVKSLTKIGVIYNSGESNSVSVIEKFKGVAADENVQVVEAVISKSSDVALAFRKLNAQGVQVVYIPQDNTVISAIAQIAHLSYGTGIPVFTSDNGSVEQGAFASLSYSYEAIGQKTGDYVMRIHSGEKAKDLPIAPPESYALYINKTAAEKLSIALPKDIEESATLYE